ncbi:UDP-glycosyltransferase [Olleya sp. YSTF-M6]|uniref:UDP-glycosyltransferase n=1 Tax=Olleya sediminilitoris TaxID=2795739 RepID=A0ABS1WKJ0_9FLAO|nr:UDP-glycosyltransferase [Olleya sediminilitoris]MBL7559631.1 UDP-glycosyltransferase [Olleya sediminilitoris]
MNIKNILVATNHLEAIGGTETFTFTLIEALLKKGFNVEYFTFKKGETSKRIENNLGVNFMDKANYDLILANHNTCVNYLSRRGLLIQTCHGIFPKLEQPNRYADGHVGISDEVVSFLKNKGFVAKLIFNGINCQRFDAKKTINKKLTNVLSLSQSSLANAKIEAACQNLNLNFRKFNKYINPIWNIENDINEADLIVGLGRSAYDAMACGRTVLVYDEREYAKSFADGYLKPEMVDLCVKNNCSGRFFKKQFEIEDLVLEFKKYNATDGQKLREIVLNKFNIDNQVDEYLNYANSISKKSNVIILQVLYLLQEIKIKSRKIRHFRKKLFNSKNS